MFLQPPISHIQILSFIFPFCISPLHSLLFSYGHNCCVTLQCISSFHFPFKWTKICNTVHHIIMPALSKCLCIMFDCLYFDHLLEVYFHIFSVVCVSVSQSIGFLLYKYLNYFFLLDIQFIRLFFSPSSCVRVPKLGIGFIKSILQPQVITNSHPHTSRLLNWYPTAKREM